MGDQGTSENPEKSGIGRLEVDLSPLSVARRAAYRRLLAVLKAKKRSFVVVGSFGLSLHLGRLIDEGDLQVFIRHDDAHQAVDAYAAAGFRVDVDAEHRTARIVYGDHALSLAWGLPPPLGGGVDDVWFQHAIRTQLAELRVRVAPLEELLWLQIATHDDMSTTALVDQVLMHRAQDLDWPRLLAHFTGSEALLLAHLFLFMHRYPETARQKLPSQVVESLLDRARSIASTSMTTAMNSSTGLSVEPPVQ